MFERKSGSGKILPISPLGAILVREPTKEESEMGRRQLEPMFRELDIRIDRIRITKEG